MKRLFTLIVVLSLTSLALPAYAVRALKQSTAATVTVGPFYDATDFKTAETALTVTGWTCQFFKNDANSVIDVTASGGDNDAVHKGLGRYSLELTTGNTDTVGELIIEIQ